MVHTCVYVCNRVYASEFCCSGGDTQAMAQALGVSKADIIADVTDEDGVQANKHRMHAAVRLALSETQIIAETKTWLAAHGVNLAAFDGKYVSLNRTQWLVHNARIVRMYSAYATRVSRILYSTGHKHSFFIAVTLLALSSFHLLLVLFFFF